MQVLLIALAVAVAYLVAYHTYGRWLGKKVFNLAANVVCPSVRLRDDDDFVPTSKSVVFGHHFTSIAGTGPIVGPAIAVMWGWLPALLWVVFGSIFIGAVHDFGSLVVSLRNNGQTVGDISGRLLNQRVRLLFLFILFLALTIVLAIFGLVIANVFKQYPESIFPCLVQIPIAVGIGLWLHRRGVGLLVPSLLALAVMYLTVIYGDFGPLHAFNAYFASLPIITWVAILLVYSYIASVLPVWSLLQPRDYINSLQLVSALGLIVVGLCVAAFIGGAPPVEGATRQPLEFAAPMIQWHPKDAPLIFPFLFITIACGAISGFHCLVSSGTSSKQLKNEKDAQFVGYGSMLTEGFLATLVILACCAGLGLGTQTRWQGLGTPTGQFDANGNKVFQLSTWHTNFLGDDGYVYAIDLDKPKAGSTEKVEVQKFRQLKFEEMPSDAVVSSYEVEFSPSEPLLIGGIWIGSAVSDDHPASAVVSHQSWNSRYESWSASGGLASTVSAFVDGSANFLKAMGIPAAIAVALMGVLVASFAGTTMDTACRLQRYVIQELARTLLPKRGPLDCAACSYNLTGNTSGICPECGAVIHQTGGAGFQPAVAAHPNNMSQQNSGLGPDGGQDARPTSPNLNPWNPITWLANKHGATVFACLTAGLIAAMPAPGNEWSVANAGKGGMILWPMFGATNQLLGGLAFMVIAFYLWRRGKAVWFIVLPLVFMLIMPAWAMTLQLQEWLSADAKNWPLILMAGATLLLEVWMVIEGLLLFPKVRGVLEPGGEVMPVTQP